VHVSPLTWLTRALWIVLPATLGGLLGDAAAGGDGSTGLAAAAWAVWAIGLFASFVLLPDALTVLRIVAPLPVVGGVVAAVSEPPGALGWLGLANAAVVAVVAMSADVGSAFINGSAYGDERRVALRVPTPLLIGPIEAVWVCTAVPLPVAVSLLVRGQWVGGAVLGVVGAVLAFAGFTALSRLARRWLVLVPAGLTVVDDMALAEPILLRRTAIVRLGPAPADTDALDLTAGASGLILQADLSEPVELVPAPKRRGAVTEPVETTALLVAPSRPGDLLTLAEERRIAVGRS
jgi:hypothetical protein